MVMGLVSQTNATDNPMFPRHQIAQAAAGIICKGIGIAAQKIPIANARATESRFKCHKFC